MPSSENLRVGIVTHYMPPHTGGIELIADKLFSAYGRAGFDVRWVSSLEPRDGFKADPGRIRVACWNGFERYLGVPWPVWGVTGVKQLGRLVAWADILHVHDCLYMASALTAVLAKRARKPMIVSQHVGHIKFPSALLETIERLAYKTLGRAVLRRAAKVIFCTPAAEEFILRLVKLNSGMMRTIPYGIDTARFRPVGPSERSDARRSLSLPTAGQMVLFVGRLVERKGVSLFLEVCRQNPSVHFLMVGDGPLRPRAMKNLTWWPSIDPEKMEIVYQAADVLLLPSHGEGFPLAVLEAMATGLPVIVSRGESFAAIIEREGAALCAERTAAGLCGAIDKLRATKGLAGGLGNRGRELVLLNWSLDAMNRQYLKVIVDVAERNSRP